MGALRLGVELPPVPFDPGGSARGDALEDWVGAAGAAVRAGAGAVWFTGADPAHPDVGGPQCDACTLAAALSTSVPGVHLGVVASLPDGRHPAVVARDVTTLDVVSGGRAAVLFRWSQRDPAAADEAWGRLTEAVSVCRAVLSDDDPAFDGRHYAVSGARNRPPPLQGTLPVLAQLPAGTTALAGWGGGARELLRPLLGSSGLVCPDDPGEVAMWRAAIDDAAALAPGRDGEPDLAPPLLCRTTLGPLGASGAERLRAARRAGADGVLVRLPGGRRGDVAPVGRSGALEAAMALAFGAWAA